MNKTAIKNFAIWARRKLISDITYRAGMLGITENGIAQPMKQSTKDLQFFDIGTKDYVEISGAEIQQRNALLAAIRRREKCSDYKTAFRSVVEEVAYTWFNRLIAVRFMEVNEYLPSYVRVISSTNPNKLEPDLVTTPFDTDLEFSAYEKDLVLQLKDQNKLDELFRMLFIKQCNKLSQILPELFEKISDYTELLLTISFTDKDGVIYHLTHDISEDDFNVEKEGQVEIIGWLYQYYNTEPKDEVFALLKKNVKITKERIPAATQLFTPDWIVRYMVENSLGRLWVEGHPDEDIKANWKYYLEEAEQEPEVQAQLAKIREEYEKLNPEDIKLIDPCMGSGHILVYAFDVLMQIYLSCGYTQRDAAKSILQNNLYGIDIDTRAYQLAYFAVMMKARQYNRRIFGEGILPNLMAVKNPAPCSDACLNQLGKLEPLGKRLIEDFQDAEEYGSILQLSYTKEELDALEQNLAELREFASFENMLVRYEIQECIDTIAPLARQARIMSQKYDVVVTNPPYMGNMPTKMTAYVRKHYTDEKYDLYSVFVRRAFLFSFPNGYISMITQQAWMFLSSFEKFRTNLQYVSLVNMAHLGARAFEEISGEVVQTVTFTFRNLQIENYKGVYKDLTRGKSQGEKEILFFSEPARISGQHIFGKIPGNIYAYWIPIHTIQTFSNKKLGDVSVIKSGIVTGDNDVFLRMWFEISINRINAGHRSFVDNSNILWVPMHKGGGYRKHYGLHEHVMNLHELWEPGKTNVSVRKGDPEYYFKKGLTWSTLSNSLSVRQSPTGFVFDTKGSMCFPFEDEDIPIIEAFLNSKVAAYYMSFLSPTLDFNQGAMSKVPFIQCAEKKPRIIILSKDCVEIAKTEWDSFETSWDFLQHPFLKCVGTTEEERTCVNSFDDTHTSCPVEYAYVMWMLDCDERFNRLKANEEELNRIFIGIYGLQGELTPDVEEKDVTVRKADLQRDIKSFISYAVGCMFGRYSLDAPGLAYAGGEWDDSKYKTFLPDPDNCIPITDEEYFQDDIVGRFVEFIRTVYGADTLEENLEFIAMALGNSGKTARDTIRQYFLKDFFKDHLKIYQKRPIYWLFDSGKQNGFKALVYMHRWNADTVGNLRVEYLHKMQTVYEREIETCQDAVDNSLNGREVAAAAKRKEKLQKQLKECRDYDAKVAHIALSRIDIDLDDGVKVNYRKVQTGADGKFCEILADSKDIMVKEDSPLWRSLVSNRSQTN